MAKRYAIGIDLGGTYVKSALVDRSGKLSFRTKLRTADYKTREALIDALAATVKEILKKAKLRPRDLAGVGVGVPGPVDFGRGFVHYLTNVRGWKNVALKKILSAKLKIPVGVDNDVNLMTLGEYFFGAGKKSKVLVCMTLGTGVGGGIIIGGELYRGTSSVAGEIGHIPLKEDGLPCNCGGYGCLERYVGNNYLVEEIKDKIRCGAPTLIKGLVRDDLSSITPEVISRAAQKGDSLAITLWRDIGVRIGTVLCGVVNLLNPDKIVIGGGLADAGEVLFKPIRETVRKRAITISRRTVKITKAKLGLDAGIVGAAALMFKGEA